MGQYQGDAQEVKSGIYYARSQEETTCVGSNQRNRTGAKRQKSERQWDYMVQRLRSLQANRRETKLSTHVLCFHSILTFSVIIFVTLYHSNFHRTSSPITPQNWIIPFSLEVLELVVVQGCQQMHQISEWMSVWTEKWGCHLHISLYWIVSHPCQDFPFICFSLLCTGAFPSIRDLASILCIIQPQSLSVFHFDINFHFENKSRHFGLWAYDLQI